MILVTGSDGIVGRGLCKKLQELAVPFLPVTHRRKPYTLPDALFVDLASDRHALKAYIDKISAIVHLAAAVPHSASYPDNNTSANWTRCMDRNVQDIQRLAGVPAIYMSTCGLYDRTSTKIKYEDDSSQINIISPYFSAKSDGEALFLSEGVSTVLRLAAPVGAGVKPQLVLSRFIATARENAKINIWGNGSREQDFISTADVAELIVRILEKPKKIVLNVASGVPVTMAELAETVVTLLGAGSIEQTAQPDPCDGETARYSICRAKYHYSWVPKRTLADSITDLIFEDFESN